MKSLNLAAIAAIFLLAGCAGQSVLDSPVTHVVVRAGVAEFVNGEAPAAESVIAWVDEVTSLIEGNPEILLTELRDRAVELIPWDSLSPGRQIIAMEILRYVEGQVTQRIAAGELPENATVTLREFLDTARWAAEFQLALVQ